MEKKTVLKITAILIFICIGLYIGITYFYPEASSWYWFEFLTGLIPLIFYHFAMKKIENNPKSFWKRFKMLETILIAIGFACFMASMVIVILSIENSLIIRWTYLPIIGVMIGCFCAMIVLTLFSQRLEKIEDKLKQKNKNT